MKKVLSSVFALFISICAFGQIFEGKVNYSNTYKSKNPQLTDQQWTAMLGTKQEYLIQNGNYKTITNGTMAQWQLYINKENKLYTKMSNSDNALWNDASIQGDEILKVEMNKNVVEILGYKCDELILTCKSGIQKYYFNTKLAVDSKLFTKHKLGNWHDFISKSNSLPLKSSIETAQFSLVSVATEIIPMKLESKLFELPVGIKTEKSPY